MENVAYTHNQILYINIENISKNPNQPRKYFDATSLMELSESINQFGVLQPITVRYLEHNSYELVAGERRLRASKLAGLNKIPCIILNINEKESAIIAIVENLQRNDLNFIEEAKGYNNLIIDYKLTQEELATKLGKTQSTVANKLRILRLSRNVLELVVSNNLTERHARALLRLNNEYDQLKVLKRVVEKKLNVQNTEIYVDKLLKEATADKKNANPIKFYIRDMKIFTNTIKKAIVMMNDSGIDTDYDYQEVDGGAVIKINLKYNK